MKELRKAWTGYSDKEKSSNLTGLSDQDLQLVIRSTSKTVELTDEETMRVAEIMEVWDAAKKKRDNQPAMQDTYPTQYTVPDSKRREEVIYNESGGRTETVWQYNMKRVTYYNPEGKLVSQTSKACISTEKATFSILRLLAKYTKMARTDEGTEITHLWVNADGLDEDGVDREELYKALRDLGYGIQLKEGSRNFRCGWEDIYKQHVDELQPS